MPKTLTDAKDAATKRIAAIDVELSKLDEERRVLSLDHQLGDASAEAKLRKLAEKYRVLHEQRDDATLAIAEAKRRETEQAQKDAEAQRQRVIRSREKLLADRGVVHDRIRKTGEALADDFRTWLDLTAEIDGCTTSPAIRATPTRIRSMIQSWLFGLLGKDGGAGLDEMPFIQAKLRAFPPNEP